MAVNKAYQQYKENSVYTSTPEELTFMLYNGLVRFIMQAGLAIEEKDIQKVNNSIIRAQDIVSYLQSTLDMKYDISKNLASIYEYMHRRLLEANVSKDKDILDEVLGFAKDLRDTWAQAMKLAKQQGNTHQAMANGQ